MNDVLQRLACTLDERKGAVSGSSYVASLYAKGLDSILKKIAEESAETIIAAKDGDPQKIIYEVADLWFHCMVLLAYQELGPQDVLNELARREGVSGHVEKLARQDNI